VRKPSWYFWFALFAFLALHVCLVAKIDPVYTYFFVFIWWSYIILIDSIVFWKKGESLLTRLKLKVIPLVICSYLFWEFFELINLKLLNWDYVSVSSVSGAASDGGNIFSSPILKYLFKFVAFGSVLPGILETYSLFQIISLGRRLEFLGWEKTGSLFKWRWWGRPRYLWMIIGIGMVVASIVWPTYCFWMIWVAIIFILDPDTEKHSGKGIMAELREGKVRTFYRLLVTGLFCGILWEGWNYWAGLKWTYEVPFMGDLKIFEMPVLGYLGFTVFAVESYVLYQWLSCQKTRLVKLLRAI